MKNIPDKSIDLVLTDEKIVELYLSGESMRKIAKNFNTNHKPISRILKKANITTRPSKILDMHTSLTVALRESTVICWRTYDSVLI